MPSTRVYRRCQTDDGRDYQIREGEVGDARQLIDHARSVLAESQWNITEPEEFYPSQYDEEAWILSFRQRSHRLLLVADLGRRGHPQIVGMISFTTQARLRLRHRGRLGISVHAAYRGLGIGEALLSTLLAWAAEEPELERVELSVFSHNTRAIHLYQKLGFVEEARLLRAYKLKDGSYYDDVMMVKWVKEDGPA